MQLRRNTQCQSYRAYRRRCFIQAGGQRKILVYADKNASAKEQGKIHRQDGRGGFDGAAIDSASKELGAVPLAEGRSKAQAASLKGLKKTVVAHKLATAEHDAVSQPVAADSLRKGDYVLVSAGEVIPCDGEVIEGGASVDESAITGESAPVIRESGGDFASVTGGTRILSDWLVIQCSVNPGETFLDRMIAMVEGAQRRKTPNEIALTILLVALTIVFLLATATLWPFSAWGGSAVSVTVLVALLVCLIPTTIGGLLSAIGVAGMSRMLGANVIATSGRAVEAAGDVDVLLLDKTGTITLGNRQASDFLPAHGVDEKTLADAAQLSSLADETPEGRSIVILAKQRFNLRIRDVQSLHATFVPFTAQSRMSGINIDNRMIRKGSVDAIRRHVEANGGHFPADVEQKVESVARLGATPLVVAEGSRVLGVIALMGMIQRNSVILIDQIELDRARGVPAWDAIVESAVRRLRPIVLTAAAAVLAMIPLSRSVFWGPMAVAIMGGLIVATVLTVFFLPALYAAWYRVKV